LPSEPAAFARFRFCSLNYARLCAKKSPHAF
jgi:hypothetical protein